MRFSVYFDCILNERMVSFHIEIMISAAHMLARGMLPCEKFLKKCAIWCVLVNILIGFCIKIVFFFKVFSLYRTLSYDYVDGLSGHFPYE